MKPDSHDIKEALMHYFRFKRGWVCADEVSYSWFVSDILVDTGEYSMEVEIKTSKHDLITGEAKKRTGCWTKGKKKHEEWTEKRPNKFALCVPEELLEVAEEWINKTNKKYGLYVYLSDKTFIQDKIWTRKTALKLHKKYDSKTYLKKIARRLSCTRAFEFSEINNRKKR